MSNDETPVKMKPLPSPETAAPNSKKTVEAAVKRRAKQKAKISRKTTRAQKKSVVARRASLAVSSVCPVTGKAVAELRATFDMSQSEFARLLGVSAPSIGNWEKKPGTLDLQTRTLDAWNVAKRLTRRQAWRKLDGS